MTSTQRYPEVERLGDSEPAWDGMAFQCLAKDILLFDITDLNLPSRQLTFCESLKPYCTKLRMCEKCQFIRQVHSRCWRLGEGLWVTILIKGWCAGCHSKEKTLDRPVTSSPSSVVHARGLSLSDSVYTSTSAKKQ